MRKLGIEETQEKKRKRSAIVIGILFIGLLVTSTAGFAFFGGGAASESASPYEEGVSHNGQYWVKTEQGQQTYFINEPSQSEGINVEVDLTLASYLGRPLFIDSDNELVPQLLAWNLQRFVSRVQEACYGECEKDLPEKSCEENLIVFRDAEENRVYQEQNCVFIEGNSIAADAFIHKILG